MTQDGRQHVDAIVVGANIRGLVTTYILDRLGYSAVLLDRGNAPGGMDGSFVTAQGTRFEYGMHVLDYQRSELATRLFTHVVDGRVHKVPLKRGIVLRNAVMPYAPRAADMPGALRDMLPRAGLFDDLGEDAPSRERLAAVYGQAFTDLVFDEVLPSFPSEHRHRAFGIDESRLMANIYPWFFPRARREHRYHDESRAFHNRLRMGIEQEVLYPRDGGFGGFARGFVDKFDPQRIEVLLGAGDVDLQLEPGTHRVKSVTVAGRRLSASHYFWAASWPALCRLIDVPCQDTATDLVLIGSFRLNRPAWTGYNEILVGDPDLSINRVYFPASFRESDEPLMQVEFAFPRADGRSREADFWQQTWVADLRRLGILDERHAVEEFDLKTAPMHFNAFGMEGVALRDADSSLLQANSNIRPVVPSLANLNLNAHVPRTLAYVTSVLADVPAG